VESGRVQDAFRQRRVVSARQRRAEAGQVQVVPAHVRDARRVQTTSGHSLVPQRTSRTQQPTLLHHCKPSC